MGYDITSPTIGASGPPTGPAGGDLTGSYPNPTIKTPVTLGVVTVTSINKYTLTAPATGATLAIADGKVFTVSTTMTLTGTASQTVNFTGVTGAPSGTGAFVLVAGATLTTPTLGVAAGTTLDLSGAAPTVAAGHVGYGATVQTTVGAAGGASALPLAPTGYLKINVAGTLMVIPYYAQA